MTHVKLRQKPITGGRQSLYLDFYPPISHPETGEPTRRQFLRLYIYDKPKSPLDKQHNKETLNLAESIRALRQIEIQNGQYSFLLKPESSVSLVAYYKEQAAKRSGSNLANWQSSLYYLEKFFGAYIQIKDLNTKLCNEYRTYILNASSKRSNEKKLSRNSTVSYFNKFKVALRQAYKDGLLKTDLNFNLQTITTEETHRNYLSLEELQKLTDTKCTLPVLKRAALFSALTGLRFSDIAKLVWSEVNFSVSEGYTLRYRQQKTKGVEIHNISAQAYNLLGDSNNISSRPFEGLVYSAQTNKIFRDWVAASGITKYVTFHCLRHTYAVLQLAAGTDIYTVSKLMGHRELKTTQIYAKAENKAKREAAERIKINL